MGRQGLRSRAVLAVLRMVAYYVLSCAMVVGLSILGVALLITLKASGLIGIIAAGCLAGAGLVACVDGPAVRSLRAPGDLDE